MAVYYSTYHFPIHKSGDTFLGLKFTLKNASGNAISLIGVTIELVTSQPVIRSLTSLNDAGITITDAVNGEFEINEQIISWTSGIYDYEIIFTFDGGRKRTYIVGTWQIIN